MQPRVPSVLSSALCLDRDQVFWSQVLELVRVQAALLRRIRAREAAERQRRRRQYARRRRAFVLSSVSSMLSLLSASSRHVWVRMRGPDHTFWSCAESFDDGAWKAQFRVTRATFDYLLEQVSARITRRRTNYRAPIEPRRRLAIALWWFGRSAEYRSIAAMFGVGVATVCVIVRQVTSAIVERLFHRVVSLPRGRQLDDTVSAFRARRYPQCGGAIGGSHIPITPPRLNPDRYLNRAGWHSVILQAVVDPDLSFTHVHAGRPGSASGAAVLRGSDLNLQAEDGHLFSRQKSVVCDGVEIPVHLVGDASFPLKPWLMKGYGRELQPSAERRRFSCALSSARSVVDAAFARLKGRWRCLLKKSDVDVSVMPGVVAACCVLHNVCECRGDAFLPEWSVEAAPHGSYLRQPDMEECDGDTSCGAEVIRDAITSNLLTLLQH